MLHRRVRGRPRGFRPEGAAAAVAAQPGRRSQSEAVHAALAKARDARLRKQEEQLALPPKQPQSKNDMQDGRVASCLFTSDTLRGCWVHSGTLLGISRKSLARTVGRLAALVWKVHERFCDKFLQQLVTHAEPDGPSGLVPWMFLRVREYDETPIKLTLFREDQDDSFGSLGGSSKTKDAYPCKLFVTHHRFAAVMVDASQERRGQLHSAAKPFAALSFDAHLLTPLQVIATNSGQHIGEALLESCRRSYNQMAYAAFSKVVDVVTSDDYSGNHAGERILKDLEAGDRAGKDFTRLHVTCDVHKIHGCAKTLFDLLPGFSSGLIKSALALRTGQMARFRTALREVLSERLRVYQGEPHSIGVDIQHHQNQVLATFFTGCSQSSRLAIQKLLNGDWTVEDEVQHFCSGPQCCSSRQQTLQMIFDHVSTGGATSSTEAQVARCRHLAGLVWPPQRYPQSAGGRYAEGVSRRCCGARCR